MSLGVAVTPEIVYGSWKPVTASRRASVYRLIALLTFDSLTYVADCYLYVVHSCVRLSGLS